MTYWHQPTKLKLQPNPPVCFALQMERTTFLSFCWFPGNNIFNNPNFWFWFWHDFCFVNWLRFLSRPVHCLHDVLWARLRLLEAVSVRNPCQDFVERAFDWRNYFKRSAHIGFLIRVGESLFIGGRIFFIVLLDELIHLVLFSGLFKVHRLVLLFHCWLLPLKIHLLSDVRVYYWYHYLQWEPHAKGFP